MPFTPVTVGGLIWSEVTQKEDVMGVQTKVEQQVSVPLTVDVCVWHYETGVILFETPEELTSM